MQTTSGSRFNGGIFGKDENGNQVALNDLVKDTDNERKILFPLNYQL
jgi:hypothetical protein